MSVRDISLQIANSHFDLVKASIRKSLPKDPIRSYFDIPTI